MGDKGAATAQESAVEAWQRVEVTKREAAQKLEIYLDAKRAYQRCMSAHYKAREDYRRLSSEGAQ